MVEMKLTCRMDSHKLAEMCNQGRCPCQGFVCPLYDGKDTCPCSQVSSTQWVEYFNSTELSLKADERGNVLKKAFKTINGQRQDEYGNPEDCFDMIALFWNEWLRTKLITRYDVAMMMALLKVARENHLHKEDNIVDACGYLALARDMMESKE